jgi:hypothetical protein
MELFISTLAKFWYTMLIVFIISRFLYYRYQGKKEILFTLILLSAIISFLCILISRVELSLGFALGIFAIFGIIRYRTTQVTPREMTYLFLSAGTAAKNILAPADLEFYRLVISDVSILALAALAEYFLFRGSDNTKRIVYNNLELIHPDKRTELENDLGNRFGISEIQNIKVGNINTAKNTADLLVYFKDPRNYNFNK